jgi:hypothetical protein
MLKQMLKIVLKNIFFILLYTSICGVGFAQKIVRGHVEDAKTGESLPATNIQIEGTYQGTISNQDGDFSIPVETIPSNLMISYIGYESQKVRIDSGTPRKLRIRLNPIILEMDPIVISAEDPAMAIMRKVIRRKLEWRAKLNTYRAEAYSRLIFENDSGIVSIAESLSETFWDKEKGSREVIKSKRQTNNLSETQNFAVASFIPNFYDDDIDIAGFKAIGPTNPDALDFYRFKLVNERKMDDKKVYDIQVIPDSKLQPMFHGMLSVLDEEFAVLNVDLVPSESIRFPYLIQELNLHYKQQFDNYDSDFWLPVDYRVEGDIKVGMTGLQFPKIIYKRITALTDYAINIPLPDSLYKEEKILSVDSSSVEIDTLFAATTISVPLTTEEDSAYHSLDSTMTLEKAFKPTGFLANMIELTAGDNRDKEENGKNIFSYLSPQLWYNRVDGLHAGLTARLDITNDIEFKIGGGYKTGSKDWGYFSQIKARFGPERRWFGLLEYNGDTDSRYQSESWSPLLGSFPPFFGREDYFDYYRREGLLVDLGYKFSELRSRISVGFLSEKHLSLEKTTDYNLFNTGFVQRENPAINDGTMHSIIFKVRYGDNYIPFGAIGQKRALLTIETSQPDLITTDYSFTMYTLSLDWRFTTFLSRRLFPNALDFHISTGTSTGELPLQRFGIVDGSFEAVSPYASLRTRKQRPYEGEHFFAIYWEHNFRTVPFELINLDFAVDHGIGIIVYGSHGRSWISDERLSHLSFPPAYTNKFHNELGFSINNIFSILRMDTSYRIDNNLFYVGVSLARFF